MDDMKIKITDIYYQTKITLSYVEQLNKKVDELIEKARK